MIVFFRSMCSKLWFWCCVCSDSSNGVNSEQQNIVFHFLIHPTTLCLLFGIYSSLILTDSCHISLEVSRVCVFIHLVLESPLLIFFLVKGVLSLWSSLAVFDLNTGSFKYSWWGFSLLISFHYIHALLSATQL